MECLPEQKHKSWCQETGRYQQSLCEEQEVGHLGQYTSKEVKVFRSCNELPADEEEFRAFLFLGVMGSVGAIAYWLIQKRKHLSMNAFDARKYQMSLN